MTDHKQSIEREAEELTPIEEAFNTLCKLHRMHGAAKKLYGDEYESKIAPYKDCLTVYMTAQGMDNHIQAAIEVAEEITKRVEDSAVGVMNIFAAAVEILETKKQPK